MKPMCGAPHGFACDGAFSIAPRIGASVAAIGTASKPTILHTNVWGMKHWTTFSCYAPIVTITSTTHYRNANFGSLRIRSCWSAPEHWKLNGWSGSGPVQRKSPAPPTSIGGSKAHTIVVVGRSGTEVLTPLAQGGSEPPTLNGTEQGYHAITKSRLCRPATSSVLLREKPCRMALHYGATLARRIVSPDGTGATLAHPLDALRVMQTTRANVDSPRTGHGVCHA
jgi:hypothetical protein